MPRGVRWSSALPSPVRGILERQVYRAESAAEIRLELRCAERAPATTATDDSLTGCSAANGHGTACSVERRSEL
jgi:hypothetical protein